MNNYDDIIYLKHDIKRIRMPISERSSIFMPFSALSGFSDLIDETEREVINEIIIDDNKKELLDAKIRIINNNLPCKVLIKYFVKDKLKDGGNYIIKDIVINKIDNINKLIITSDKEKIDINNIYEIERKV